MCSSSPPRGRRSRTRATIGRRKKTSPKHSARVSRRTKGSHRRRKAVGRLRRAHQTVQRQRADFHHKTALALLRNDAAIFSKTCGSSTWCGIGASRSPFRTRAGPNSVPSSKPRQRAPGVELWRSPRSIPARTVRAVGTCAQIAERAHPRLHVLWPRAGPRRECGQEHSMGRADPSGTRGVPAGEPRSVGL